MTPTAPGLTGGGVSGDPLRANLALMAPGTALRDGLERILRGRTGALIVLGYDAIVEQICTGGAPAGMRVTEVGDLRTALQHAARAAAEHTSR